MDWPFRPVSLVADLKNNNDCRLLKTSWLEKKHDQFFTGKIQKWKNSSFVNDDKFKIIERLLTNKIMAKRLKEMTEIWKDRHVLYNPLDILNLSVLKFQ